MNRKMIDLLFWFFLILTLFIFHESVFMLVIAAIILLIIYSSYRLFTNKREQMKVFLRNVCIDQLTGLPNRRGIVKKLNRMLKTDQKFAVLYIQFERFKQVNDVFGEPFGERFLMIATEKLTSLLQSNWELAKLHGSQYCLVMKGTADINEIKHWADHLITQLQPKISMEGKEISFQIRIGISIGRQDGGNGEELINNARLAVCKDIKCQKKYRFFHKQMINPAYETWVIEEGLQRALVNNELVLHYQPQVDFLTGKVNGVEALVRWNHPKRGMMSPAQFIPIAERTGLINEIGNWVLASACQQIKIWEKSGLSDTNMSVNVSIHQLITGDFLKELDRVLIQTGIAPEKLTLEITESTLISDQKVIPMLHDIKARGVKLAIDDFGTGYSSLSYLAELPIDFLKIDKRFIQNVAFDKKTFIIVKSIIQVASSIGVRTIAEGIETTEQYELLKKSNCNLAQGYFISRPVESRKVFTKLRQFQFKQTRLLVSHVLKTENY